MANEFPETEWSQILGLRGEAESTRKEILGRLIERYWKPAYGYLRALRRGHPEDDARDLTQQFFALLLARGDFDRLDPARGSFRGFLKTALRNFVTSTSRAENARPRLFAFADADEQIAMIDREADQPPDPEQAFDRAWIRVVLDDAVARLRTELEDGGKSWLYATFAAYCLNDDEHPTYEHLAARHGKSLDDVRNGLRQARQRLRELLRGSVRAYLAPGDDVDEELSFVLGGGTR